MNISLQPKQLQLLNLVERSNYEWIGYGGARGGAKSHAIRDIAIYLGMKYNISSLIFRRYSQELLDNHVYPIQRLYPELRAHIVKSPEILLYNPKTKIPMIKFGYAERIEDVYKEQGSEYQIIFIDEATQLTQDMIEWLQTSCRDSRGLLPTCAKMVLSCNPGGVGHGYIKRIFIEKSYVENEDPKDFAFIQAHVWDNVAWVYKKLSSDGYKIKDYYTKWTEEQRMNYCIKHSSYARRLSKLPSDLKKAYLYGDWDVFGGMFFKGFNRAKQIINPFKIPEEWSLVGSMDPGFASPLSFGLQSKDLKGKIYRIATYYEVDKIPNHAKSIKDWLSIKLSYLYPFLKGRLPDYIAAGHDAFAKLDRNAILSNENTVQDFFQEQGLQLIKANTDRISGWWAWKSLFPDKYFIFENFNKPLVDCMGAVLSDKKKPEDIEGCGRDPNVEDHPIDDGRYGVTALFTPAEPPEEDHYKDKEHWGVPPKERNKKDIREIWNS